MDLWKTEFYLWRKNPSRGIQYLYFHQLQQNNATCQEKCPYEKEIISDLFLVNAKSATEVPERRNESQNCIDHKMLQVFVKLNNEAAEDPT